MKLISFDERPEQRTKDPRDIANIIDHFLDLQGDLIFNNHNDLFTEDVKEDALDEISATVIGREIKKICADNEKLLERLKQMLQLHINQKEESVFVRNMVAETGGNVEKSVRLLKNIESSIN